MNIIILHILVEFMQLNGTATKAKDKPNTQIYSHSCAFLEFSFSLKLLWC